MRMPKCVSSLSSARPRRQAARLKEGLPRRRSASTGPLRRALQKVWVFRFVDPGPGGSGGPRKALRAIPRGFGDFRGPSGSPRDPPRTETENLRAKKKRLSNRVEAAGLLPGGTQGTGCTVKQPRGLVYRSPVSTTGPRYILTGSSGVPGPRIYPRTRAYPGPRVSAVHWAGLV